jgi:hypothetical protein
MGASPRSGLQWGVTGRHGLRSNPYTGRSFLSRSSSIPSGGRADLGWYNGWPNFRTLCISALDAKTRHRDGCAAKGTPANGCFVLLPSLFTSSSADLWPDDGCFLSLSLVAAKFYASVALLRILLLEVVAEAQRHPHPL